MSLCLASRPAWDHCSICLSILISRAISETERKTLKLFDRCTFLSSILHFWGVGNRVIILVYLFLMSAESFDVSELDETINMEGLT
jgi:hypothetical protein